MMKQGVMIINTSRGGLINTKDAIEGLKSGKIGYLGIDVYEHEAPYFFEDHSGKPLADTTFMTLLSFPNVVCSGHQAFFTEQAMNAISSTTLQNVDTFVKGKCDRAPNRVVAPAAAPLALPKSKL
eukprot:TRINITY_DN1961_c0_g1_i2.p1 TRINITY_DN1961_c0_g1~~TRINITY_DN1961_c0_g1_i2.p1  ORF type:complete len:125 (-),score=19.37 TRINITY_DN1961_c0_g1_i2:66-440(-)